LSLALKEKRKSFLFTPIWNKAPLKWIIVIHRKEWYCSKKGNKFVITFFLVNQLLPDSNTIGPFREWTEIVRVKELSGTQCFLSKCWFLFSFCHIFKMTYKKKILEMGN
jgi:hypothetical protein